MKFSFKIIVAIWFVLLSILAGVVYTAYLKLEPQALIGLMREQVERNYPGTELKVAKTNYRLGLDFKLTLNDITMIRAQKNLGRIGEIEIKIPWWLFLTDKGSAQINISHLEIFVDRQIKASGASPSTNSAKPDLTPVKVKATVPSFFLTAKYTIRAKDISIRDLHDSHRYFNLSKLLIREFRYGKNSAFELTLPIEVNHNAAKYNSELWLFGDLTPRKDYWSLNYRGEFKTTDVSDRSQLEDVVIDGKAEVDSHRMKINSSMNFLIDKENIGSGKVTAENSNLDVSLDFRKFPLNYLGILNEEIKNPFLPQLEGYAQGKLHLIKNNTNGSLSLSSRLSFEGVFPLDETLFYAGTWQLQFNDSKWKTSFMTPNGEVSFFRRSIIDFDSGSLVQYNEEIGFSGIDFSKAVHPIKKLSEVKLDQIKSYFVSAASFKNCLQGDQKVNGEIKYGRSPDMLFYQIDLQETTGKLKAYYQQKAQLEQFSLEASQYPWKDYQFFFPYFTAKEGLFDGKVQGNWMQSWDSGEWLGNLTLTGVTQATGPAAELAQKVLAPFELLATPAPQIWKVEVKKNKIELKSLVIATPDPAHISGVLQSDISAIKPSLTLGYPKNKRWKPLKKMLTNIQDKQ